MAWEPTQLREWHEQVMDFMILNPRATYDEIAQAFNSHPQSIGCIIRSDLFQARLRERRERRGEAVQDRIMAKLGKLAETSVDALQMRIERERQALGIADIRDTAEMALHGLGYGKPVGPQRATQEVNLQVVMVSKDELAAARSIMRRGAVQEDMDDAQPMRAISATG
jgi:hypothetical protein